MFYVLQDAVDCPEWIVPFHVFKSLAEEVLLIILVSLGLTLTCLQTLLRATSNAWS